MGAEGRGRSETSALPRSKAYQRLLLPLPNAPLARCGEALMPLATNAKGEATFLLFPSL